MHTTSYEIKYSQDSLFINNTVTAEQTDTVYNTTELKNATTYYWKVRGKNEGGPGPWSSAWAFQTVARLSDAPVLIEPLAGITNVPTFSPLLLKWFALTDVDMYEIKVYSDSSFTSGKLIDSIDISETSVSLTGLNTDSTYYWMVRGKNGGGTGPWSSFRKFQTTSKINNVPIYIEPVDGITNVSTLSPLILRWTGLTDADTYEIKIYTDSSFTSGMLKDTAGVTDTSLSLTGLKTDTTYYWKVRGTNAGGSSPWSDLWTFQTLPDEPMLIEPANGITSVSILSPLILKWSSTSSADTYEVKVFSDSLFTTGVVKDTTGITNTTISISGLSNASTYYWKVRGTNAGGSSKWSAIWIFQTVPNEPDSLILIEPANGIADISTSSPLILKWSSLSDIDTYELKVSSDSSFATGIIKDTVGVMDTTISISGLSNASTYYWKVRGTNEGGSGPWSSVWTFRSAELWKTNVSGIFYDAGNIGIGTQNPDTTELAVKGKIHTEGLIIDTDIIPDYVFEEDHVLKSLNEVERYIRVNKHLPGIPSAKEVKEKGMRLGEMHSKLLEKIEELTRYLIDMKKEQEKTKTEFEKLTK